MTATMWKLDVALSYTGHTHWSVLSQKFMLYIDNMYYFIDKLAAIKMPISTKPTIAYLSTLTSSAKLRHFTYTSSNGAY